MSILLRLFFECDDKNKLVMNSHLYKVSSLPKKRYVKTYYLDSFSIQLKFFNDKF